MSHSTVITTALAALSRIDKAKAARRAAALFVTIATKHANAQRDRKLAP